MLQGIFCVNNVGVIVFDFPDKSSILNSLRRQFFKNVAILSQKYFWKFT